MPYYRWRWDKCTVCVEERCAGEVGGGRADFVKSVSGMGSVPSG